MSSSSSGTLRQYLVLLLLLGFLVLLPFIILCCYTHPSFDDYTITIRDKETSFWATQLHVYKTWSGRYFATAISRINPLLYWPVSYYKVYAILLIVSLVSALYLLLSRIYKNYCSGLEKASLCAFVFIVLIVQMPDIAQGLFWFSGYMTYQFANILTLLFLVNLYWLFYATSRVAKMSFTFLASTLAAAVIGLNEMSMIGVVLVVVLIVYESWHSAPSTRPYVFVVLMVCVVASLVVVMAPGNYKRMASQAQPLDFLLSGFGALSLAGLAFYKWGVVLIIASLIYAIIWGVHIAGSEERTGIFNIGLFPSFTFYLAAVLLMHFSFIWATGQRAGTRVENVIYFFFVLGWFYNLQLLLNKVLSSSKVAEIASTKLLLVPLLIVFLLTVFSSSSNVSTAYLDLLSGNAQAFNEKMNQRYSLLKQSECESCVVPALKVLPKSLYIWHMLPRTEAYEMGASDSFAAYWGKNSVRLSGAAPEIKENYELLKEIGKGVKEQLLVK